VCATGGHRLRFRVALYSIPGCIWGAHFRHVETPAIGPPTTRRKQCHDTGLPAPLFDQCRLLSAGSSCIPETPVLGALGPGGCAMKVFDATPGATRTAEPTDAGSSWYRRPGTPAPRRAATPTWDPPEVVVPPPPPPPPPPQLVLRYDEPITAAFVSIANNANQSAVGCVLRSVAVAGVAAGINYNAEHAFTVTGSEEARIPQGSSEGPATGSTFHVTVTCDNGLSTSVDKVY